MKTYLDSFPVAKRTVRGVEVDVVMCPTELPADLVPVNADDTPEITAQPRGHGQRTMQREYDEHVDLRYFESAETSKIRSLMRPKLFKSDWTWPAPAARCRSCGRVTWTVKIVDGLRMLSKTKHKKGCDIPPSILEVLCAKEQ